MAVQKLGVTSDEGLLRGSQCNVYKFFLYRNKKVIEKLM